MSGWLPQPGQKAVMTIEVTVDAAGDLMADIDGRGGVYLLTGGEDYASFAQPSDAQSRWGAVFTPLESSVEGAG